VAHYRLTDRRLREVPVISDASEKLIKVRGFSPASLVMRHRAAVTAFVDGPDLALLAPFEGLSFAKSCSPEAAPRA